MQIDAATRKHTGNTGNGGQEVNKPGSKANPLSNSSQAVNNTAQSMNFGLTLFTPFGVNGSANAHTVVPSGKKLFLKGFGQHEGTQPLISEYTSKLRSSVRHKTRNTPY